MMKSKWELKVEFTVTTSESSKQYAPVSGYDKAC